MEKTASPIEALAQLSAPEREKALGLISPSSRAQVERLVRRALWTADPVIFAEDVFGLRIWRRQAEFLRAVVGHERVAVRAGRKVSKSLSLAIIAYWWMAARAVPGSAVVMMSASGRQISTVLWPEIKKLYSLAKDRGYDLCAEPSTLPDTGVLFPVGKIIGFSTDDREKAQGISGPDVLYLIDEASGVDDPILEAIEGNMAGGGQCVFSANPTRAVGAFFNAFHADRDIWFPVRISSEESPYVTGEWPEVKAVGLARPQWIEERKRKWGENSVLYRVHVRGEFPTGSTNTVVGIDLVDAATQRWPSTIAEGALTIGVDVARFGDDSSVIWPVRGLKALLPLVLQGLQSVLNLSDTMSVVGQTLKLARELRAHGERVTINVDTIGVGGGVADALRQAVRTNCENWIDVYDVNASAAASDDQYDLLRDQLWFGIQRWIQGGGAFESDAALEQELVECRYDFSSRSQRIKVEAKADLKKRLGRSPDKADALALAVWQPEPEEIGEITIIDTPRFTEPKGLSKAGAFGAWAPSAFPRWGL